MVHLGVAEVKRGRGHRGHKRTMPSGCTLVGYWVTHWCVHKLVTVTVLHIGVYTSWCVTVTVLHIGVHTSQLLCYTLVCALVCYCVTHWCVH